MRKLSREAFVFQHQPHKVVEPLDKVFVLFNPSANGGKAKKHFYRFAAPLLYLAGSDVTIIELESESHLREMVEYLPPNVASILVAGGSGTLLNVVTALLRRKDHLREWDKVPIGFIPLGRRNVLGSKILSRQYKLRSEQIGRSVIACLEGNSEPVDVMELVTEEGKRVYALGEVLWGPLVEGTIVANRYSLLGPLRGFFGFLRHAFKVATSEEIGIDGNEKCELSAFAISAKNGFLRFKSWNKIESKLEFAKLGTRQTSYQSPADFLDNQTGTNLSSVRIRPIRDARYWYHIDGEEFEPFPVEIRILKNKLHFFTAK